MASPDELIGTSLGQYEIVRLLGKGGMATVYVGVQRTINRSVAIKVLPRSLMHDDTFMQRFRREAEVIARLEHFHIVPIYDYGEADGVPYIVTRFLEGGVLQDRIERGDLSWPEIVSIVSQVASALDYAHAREVIHRDIKPTNVLLDSAGNAYLADFGIAKVYEGTARLTGSTIVGTPAYMAPEQSEAASPTPAMDIYALGVTLFEMITGRPPYVGETPIAQILMHIQQPVPSLQSIDPDIPAAVDAVVQRAMAKNPAARFGTAGDLARSLEAAITSGEEPAEATVIEVRPALAEAVPTVVDVEVVGRREATAAVKSPRRKTRRALQSVLLWFAIGAALVTALALGIVVWSTLPGTAGRTAAPASLPQPATSVSEATVQPNGVDVISALTATSSPSSAPSPSPSPASSATGTVVPTTLPATITLRGAKMLLVPEGAFVMGSDEGYPHERPAHEVFLSAFYIDELEVTNLFYGACVEAGACEPPVFVDSPSQIAYYGSEYYYDFPVIYVTWGEAQAYCRWRGGHLPLEAQWEKAARWDPGSGESRQFPWIPPVLDPYYLNYASVLGRTTVVGSYPAGISPIGALDMAGNVSEWVYDWYQDNYYEQSPYDNPRGPLQGEFKVFRGGSYEAQGNGVTTTFRDYTGPATRLPTVGFRCAWTPSGDPTGP